MSLNCSLLVRPNSLGDNRRRSSRSNWARQRRMLPTLLMMLTCWPSTRAQVPSSIKGVVTDPSGAPVPAATVTTKNMETGAARSAGTDDEGRYQIVWLPVGQYQVAVTKPGFEEAIRSGIRLVVGQEARVDLTLQVSTVKAEVTVTQDAPMVSTTTRDISGLVSEQQVKELPLNGRSYDLLLPLNPGIVNFTWMKTGGIGISNSTTGNNFAVSGNRPQQNLFLLNGVEFTGAAENNMQPGGTSGMLLGVDAVREFNVQRDSYGAEFGKRPGGQVVIVTQSGTNQWHGTAFEFLRNNVLDAPNFFDQGDAPPFRRNQFGASTGGPVQKDKTFLFGNYEGFRQSLHQTSATFVPDAASRAAAVPSVQPLLNLWPTPPAGAPDFSGIAEVFGSPLQTIQEEFGTARADHIFSERDTLAGIYTIDDGQDFTATPLDSFSSDVVTLREQVATLEETHVFSPVLVNNARYIGPGHMHRFLDTPLDLLDKHLDANVMAPLVLTRLLLPHMTARGSGLIANVTSGVAWMEPKAPAGAGGWGLGYAISKGALHRVAGVLHAEVFDRGISCVNVEPGYVATERIAQDMARFGYDSAAGAPPPSTGCWPRVLG